MHQTQTGFREGRRRACQGFFRRHTPHAQALG